MTSNMIILRSTHIMARIDPAHGAEVVDLIDLATGRQALGRPPFSSDVPRGGDLDEETWTRSYRGGWQMLTPNAGNSSRVGAVQHGFHGRASNDPWIVQSANESSATLVWTGHGITVTRRFEAGDSLRVSVTMKALDKRVPAVVVEHIALGYELLDPCAVDFFACRRRCAGIADGADRGTVARHGQVAAGANDGWEHSVGGSCGDKRAEELARRCRRSSGGTSQRHQRGQGVRGVHYVGSRSA